MGLLGDLEFAVDWTGEHVKVLDQTQLPHATVIKTLQTVEQVYDSIKRLEVRGAPSIGICGAFGLAMASKQLLKKHEAIATYLAQLREIKEYINSSRPTAVNLSWALNRLFRLAERESDPKAVATALETEALLIREENVAECRAIGEHGLSLCEKGETLMTICNTGGLATARYGTALAIMLLGQERGFDFKIFALETRPLLQGGRLTTWELQSAGADVTLITDSMAAVVLRDRPVARVLVGADRVARNGDTANKIGTYGLALLARAHGVPFYVAAPLSSFDFSLESGAGIIVEERPASEVRGFGDKATAPEACKVFNPSFDVTPSELITGYVTEHGVFTAAEFPRLITLA
eukprot:Protomagalhaensia_wolfi_Nauph_80__6292@NODE_969_length_1844_cov_23_966759_g733_i0_p1_GENE_NODE_969_length_1844_cov_23_966759_g733_i0NODE_969_length_1844_cov_23_966759_g733_i0_p1_ORF_typecomplete_len350_score68_78IF2B/PF01008_17/6_3e77DUF1515/PF07439_11/0_55DUF1515/PF07439_11/4_1e03_NODE_969_length_1844_cov_23_966759_g733_i07541803